MYYLEKEFNVACSHKLHDISLTTEENKTIFGRCNNLHGHTFKIVLKLKSEKLNNANGMIVNFYDIKKIFNHVIDYRFDHKHLNDDELFKDIVPTSENMCYIFYNLLKPFISELYAIQVHESDTSCAEYVD